MPRKPRDLAGVFEKTPGAGVWYVRYRTKGKQVRKRVGTRALAIEALNKVRLIQATGEGVVAKTAKARTMTQDEIDGSKFNGVTVGELCDDYLAWIQSPENRNPPRDLVNPPQRIGAIKKAFGDRPAASLMPYEVLDWLDSLGKKAATMNRYRSTFSSVYRRAVERRKVSLNPVRETSQMKVRLPNPRWLQPDEEERIRTVLDGWIAACPAHYRVKRLHLRCHPHELTLAIGTGMRKGNQYAIRWEEHVDFQNRAIHLPPEMTKSGKAQTIYMIDDVYEALNDLKSIQDEMESLQAHRPDAVAPQRMVSGGRVFAISENREWWAAALKEARVKNFRWHDLRHTTASRLVESGANMKLVQEALGHASITMTARYAHVSNKALQDAMGALNRAK